MVDCLKNVLGSWLGVWWRGGEERAQISAQICPVPLRDGSREGELPFNFGRTGIHIGPACSDPIKELQEGELQSDWC